MISQPVYIQKISYLKKFFTQNISLKLFEIKEYDFNLIINDINDILYEAM